MAMKVPPKNPHFFKPIHPGFKNGLKIPVGFLKYLKGQEKEHVVVLRRSGKKWLVKLNDHRLEEGWGKFVEEHDLQLGDLLVFRHEGDMEFEVTIFDSSHCDTEYLEYLQEEAKAVEGTSKKVVKDKRKPRIVSSSKAFRRAVASTPCLGQSHVEFTVKPYCLSNGHFRLPKKFAMANGLTSKKCGLIIRDGKQRSWDFRLYTSYSNVYVGGRWGKFCIANELQVGDHIRCEVVTNREKPIWKFHDLRGSPSLQPDIKNILEDKRISDKGLHFQEQTDLKIKTSDVTARKSQVPASTSSDGANPYFISTIKPYIITNTVLYLPMAFAKSNGLINRSKMILVDDKRRSWPVRLGKTGTHFVIKRDGWTQFMIANGVQVGDSYKFDLINNGSDGTTPIAHFYYIRIKTSEVTVPKSQMHASISADDANTHFTDTNTIKPHTISNPVLILPMDFVKSNGLMDKSKMTLVNGEGTPWSVCLGRNGRSFIIKRTGWTKFMKANGVQVGDAYKLELVDNGAIPTIRFHCIDCEKDAKKHRSH